MSCICYSLATTYICHHTC